MDEKPLAKLDPEIISPQAEALFNALKEKIKGQDRALKYISRAKARLESPLRDANKPVFIALELGPSGVGKTATARAVADCLFGNPDGLTYVTSVSTIDSQRDIDRYHHEYLSKIHSEELDNLYERGGELFEEEKQLKNLAERIKALEKYIQDLENINKEESADKRKEIKQLRFEYLKKRTLKLKDDIKLALDFERAEKMGWIYNPQNPPNNLLSIILFNEIEKADESLQNYLLEIMDRGYANGISFKNSFIFMTSNVGSEEIAQQLGRHMGFKKEVSAPETNLEETIYQIATEAAKKFFAPEFIGRIDKIVVFRPLGPEVLSEILDLLINDLQKEMIAKDCPIEIKLDQSTKTYLVEKSLKYPELGARLLKNRLTDNIKDKLVNLLESQQLLPGDKVMVRLEDEELVFYKE